MAPWAGFWHKPVGSTGFGSVALLIIASMNGPNPKVALNFSCPLSRRQAEAIYALGREAVIFVLMRWTPRAAKSSGRTMARGT
ncbi:unnamed protein product [marine sediment metagenome]|uniref:Uncharacterized protein n=1 Tax=marine sediment metagenome TaxID=412755 RepID=X0ULF7_9ZZZZ